MIFPSTMEAISCCFFSSFRVVLLSAEAPLAAAAAFRPVVVGFAPFVFAGSLLLEGLSMASFSVSSAIVG
jgi:hypothetical protein